MPVFSQNVKKKLKPFLVKRSRTGFGLFAAKPFKKGDFIIEYKGKKITNTHADAKGGKYLFDLNSRYTLDGSSRTNLARYINHACVPNCDVYNTRGKVLVKAKRSINPGEELSYHYGKEYFDHFIKAYGCKCASCRKSKKH